MVICESGNRHTFRVYLPEARSVQLVGGFTDWRTNPARMTREHTGWWTITMDLPPGDHDFSYLVDETQWVADFAASGVRRNPFGGWVSQVHVEGLPVQVHPARRFRTLAEAQPSKRAAA
ncbi:MAG: hypothetical protein K2W85_17510 [Phycisphaerales bacterium]|nr:hypothetical protein [Phycisphaerales bacterium]